MSRPNRGLPTAATLADWVRDARQRTLELVADLSDEQLIGPHMPIVNPLVFYPWRAFDIARTVWQWYRLVRRHKAIMERVKADPMASSYIDQALTPPIAGTEDHVVQIFADKIPKTHGAPVNQAIAAR